METIQERPYKIVRTLPDGQRVLIGTFEDVSEASADSGACRSRFRGQADHLFRFEADTRFRDEGDHLFRLQADQLRLLSEGVIRILPE